MSRVLRVPAVTQNKGTKVGDHTFYDFGVWCGDRSHTEYRHNVVPVILTHESASDFSATDEWGTGEQQ